MRTFVLAFVASLSIGAAVSLPRAQVAYCPNPKLQELLSVISFSDEPDGQGGTVRTLTFTGVNVRIVNGLGQTDSINGAGNLIVGYNELGNPSGDNRTGSHAIVCGLHNSYSSWSNVVMGQDNTTSGFFATVLGGSAGFATNTFSTVVGGRDNAATGPYAVVSGGELNLSSGQSAAVSGGKNNQAVGNWSAISGGGNSAIASQAIGPFSSISGGQQNVANGNSSHICGGLLNTTNSGNAVVSGGAGRFDIDNDDWVGGSLREDN